MSNSGTLRLPQALLDAAEIEWARRKAAVGDQFPLIECQWPGIVLDDAQRDIISSIFNPLIREVYAKGNTSCGKGASLGLAICCWFFVFPDAKVVCTSSSSEHAEDVIFGEVAKWWSAMVCKGRAELRTVSLFDGPQHYVQCVNPFHGESFSGRHGLHTMFVFDEATAVPDEMFKLAMTQATKFVALANPRTLSGAFKRAFTSLCADPDKTQTVQGPYGRRRCITISGADCLNVREKRLMQPMGPIGGIQIGEVEYAEGEPIPLDDYEQVTPIIPGQLCYDTYLSHCTNPDSRWVSVFAHGKFPKEDPEKQVILDSWLDRHIEAWNEHLRIDAFGLDVADSDNGDETLLAAGGLNGVRGLHARRKEGTMETVGWAINVMRSYGIEPTEGQHPIVVDADGLGKGVADRMLELGCTVMYYRGNAATEDNKRYANRRAEGYGELGRRLDPLGQWSALTWALPDDDKLRTELAAPEKIYASDGIRFSITPKHRTNPSFKGDTLVEKLGRSPDRADAVVYLHWGVRLLAATGGFEPQDQEPQRVYA